MSVVIVMGLAKLKKVAKYKSSKPQLGIGTGIGDFYPNWRITMTREQKIAAFMAALRSDDDNSRETQSAIEIVLNEVLSIFENLESLAKDISIIANRNIRP
jgi:hypothetical protein